MAQITLNKNAVEPLGGPNLGLSVEQGDSWATVITNLNTMFTELYAGVKNGGGVNIRPAGNIFVSTTTVGSSATNTTQTLITTNLAAGSLASAGQGIYVEAWGRCAANAAPTTINMNVGGQFGSIPAAAHNASHWNITGQIYKSGTNAQQGVFYTAAGAVTGVKSSTDTSTDGSAIAVSITCLDASAAQSNVLLDGMSIEFFS